MASIADAINANNVRILKLLIAVPGTFNPRDLNHGLIQAIKLGYTECVQLLLEGGADKHFTTSNTTPLHTAVQSNHLNVVKCLLSYGCHVNFKGSHNLSPLLLAAKHGNFEILDALIQCGALLDCKDREGNTSLILSAINGHHLAMKSLIKAGCEINGINNEGCSALHYACHKARGYQLLLDAGANPDIRDKDNITPLLMAATEGFDCVVKALVAAKCDVNVANNSVKRTALHILAYKGHTECINALVYGSADIDVCDAFNHSPLWYAIKNKKTHVVRLLLKSYSHADTFQCSATVTEDECPTRLAFKQKLSDVVKFLILTGYDHRHLRECLQDKELSDWLKNNEDFSHWLEYAAGAQSLKQLCRKWIRHHLGKRFYHHLHFLPVPEMMRNYLFLEELHDH